MYPKTLPIKPQIYPIWFFLGPKFNSRVWKLNRWAIEEHICSYITMAGGGGVQRGASIREVPNFPKKIGDGPMKMAPLKEKNKAKSVPMN
jgi:hypothetical protein